MYNLNRLEWHLGDERQKRFITPQGTVWSCRVVSDWDFSLLTNRFAAALAKSQDHRASCGVFVFGQRNAVRRWLRLRYPDTRASQIGERGLSLRARWLKQSEAVRCDDMAPESNIDAQANFGFDHGKAVLCSNNHQRAIREKDDKL